MVLTGRDLQEGGSSFVRGAPGVPMAGHRRAALATVRSAGIGDPGQPQARRQQQSQGQRRWVPSPGEDPVGT